MRRGAGGRSVGEGNRGVGQPGERPAAITQSQHRVPAGCSTSGEARCCSAGPVIVGATPPVPPGSGAPCRRRPCGHGWVSVGHRGPVPVRTRLPGERFHAGGCRRLSPGAWWCSSGWCEVGWFPVRTRLPGKRVGTAECRRLSPGSGGAPPDRAGSVGSRRGPTCAASAVPRGRRTPADIPGRRGGARRRGTRRAGCVRPGGAGHAGHTDVPGWMACLAQILVRRPSVRRSPRPWPGRSTSPG